MTTWEEIKAEGGAEGLKAFYKLWFSKVALIQEEDKVLRDLFGKYPLSQARSFGKWSKQEVRQLWDKATWQKEVINAS